MVHKKFSDRIGVTSPKKVLELGKVSSNLRNRLWNTLRVFGPIKRFDTFDPRNLYPSQPIEEVASEVFKVSIDKIPNKYERQVEWLEKIFTNSNTQWFLVLNALEILARFEESTKLYKELNRVLEEEGSGFRFINRQLEPISDLVEIEAIEEAITIADKFNLIGAREHLETALSHLANRPDPDYRNAIKESISMIESLIKVLGGKDNFSKVIKTLNKKLELHSQFVQGIINLYSFTSDDDGIRHAILNQSTVGYDEAKFMIVACSALFNFLTSKAAKVGLFEGSS
jgi:hypothetical protein